MTLEKIWNKLEVEEPLDIREQKCFTDGIVRGLDKLEDAVIESGKDEE